MTSTNSLKKLILLLILTISLSGMSQVYNPNISQHIVMKNLKPGTYKKQRQGNDGYYCCSTDINIDLEYDKDGNVSKLFLGMEKYVPNFSISEDKKSIIKYAGWFQLESGQGGKYIYQKGNLYRVTIPQKESSSAFDIGVSHVFSKKEVARGFYPNASKDKKVLVTPLEEAYFLHKHFDLHLYEADKMNAEVENLATEVDIPTEEVPQETTNTTSSSGGSLKDKIKAKKAELEAMLNNSQSGGAKSRSNYLTLLTFNTKPLDEIENVSPAIIKHGFYKRYDANTSSGIWEDGKDAYVDASVEKGKRTHILIRSERYYPYHMYVHSNPLTKNLYAEKAYTYTKKVNGEQRFLTLLKNKIYIYKIKSLLNKEVELISIIGEKPMSYRTEIATLKAFTTPVIEKTLEELDILVEDKKLAEQLNKNNCKDIRPNIKDYNDYYKLEQLKYGFVNDLTVTMKDGSKRTYNSQETKENFDTKLTSNSSQTKWTAVYTGKHSPKLTFIKYIFVDMDKYYEIKNGSSTSNSSSEGSGSSSNTTTFTIKNGSDIFSTIVTIDGGKTCITIEAGQSRQFKVGTAVYSCYSSDGGEGVNITFSGEAGEVITIN